MKRRSVLALPFALAAAAGTREKFRAFGMDWEAPILTDWKVLQEEGTEVLDLQVARPQQANPRRPFQYALAASAPLPKFTLELEVQRSRPKGSLILVYAWKDEAHYNYLHLSDDAAGKVDVHNGVFHCYGGDRVRISATQGPGTLLTEGWHKVKVTYDSANGSVECWVNGETSPSLKGIDLSLGAGRIGLGSFFNTARFRNFRLTQA